MGQIKNLLNAVVAFSVATSLYAQPHYDYSKLQREDLGRGVVAIRESESAVCLSWRYFSSDPVQTTFNVYRNGEKIAEVPSNVGTFYRDLYAGGEKTVYTVKAVVDGKEQQGKCESYILPADAPMGYLQIPLDKPDDGVTPAGDTFTYSANDASIGDVDGDGQYEIILKWDPSNARDNSHDGYTGNVLLDCYRLTGEKLWRIDLGRNIRAGAHYTQFMVFDLDHDGKAEVVMKTADGTVDGKGQVIGKADADYREAGIANDKEHTRTLQGRILKGNEYLTVFSGLTGEALKTVDYVPARGNVQDWGDDYANRCDRFLACVAYLDGIHPSVVMCRGYYTRTVLAAFDWDGKELTQRWVFDSNNPGGEGYAGQGNHNLRVGDVDGDGCDEIVYGSCAIDNDGKGLYTTGMGHGDAMHMTCFSPTMQGLQVWDCHENKKDGSSFRDAATGKVLFQIKSPMDVGRCMAMDIDPRNIGLEMWSSDSHGLRNLQGEVIGSTPKSMPVNMAVWWDGDLLRELLDKNTVLKYDWEENICKPLINFDGAAFNNGTKSNPCLQGDLIGDWREEVLVRDVDSKALRLYVTTIPTQYRFHTFLEDPIYRISIATQNVAYNQPTQPGFYFGTDLGKGLFRGYEFK
ncbi:rhamnogalacturonan lyase [uncultured Bacteroides sp.]|uniref:rhamnogalacturonan lyase n=1 Tax=uncultured Bacteroides sp. TaxID=162156 RepID=UPI002611C5F0|nr:rhamnogalacturonan lyase [uncultured Bacteroides sp.]